MKRTKRRFLKPCVENLLTLLVVLITLLIIMVNDFTLSGLLAIIGLILIDMLLWKILKKHGKHFQCFN